MSGVRVFHRLAIYYARHIRGKTVHLFGAVRRVIKGVLKVFNYSELVGWMRRGFRNGGWRRLSQSDRGYLNAAIQYAKSKGKIVNARVVSLLQAIIEKIRLTRSVRILQMGMTKAEKMLTLNSEVFEWCPRLRVWLLDRNYRFWLGLVELSTKYSAYVL